jgi:hypothetical protein
MLERLKVVHNLKKVIKNLFLTNRVHKFGKIIIRKTRPIQNLKSGTRSKTFRKSFRKSSIFKDTIRPK